MTSELSNNSDSPEPSQDTISATLEMHLEVDLDEQGQMRVGFTHEVSEVRRLLGVERALREFAKTKGSLCTFHPRTRLKAARMSMEPLLRFIREAALYHHDFGEVLPLHRLPPRCQALIEVADMFPEQDFVPARKLRLPEDDLPRFCIRMQRFEKELRAALRSPVIRAIENGRRRKCNKNYKAGATLLQACLVCCSRVVSVRVDLYYRKGSAMGYPNQTPEDRQAKAQQVLRQRNQLLKQVKMKYGRGLLGFMCKLEYGQHRGFHLHTWFLLNGHDHQQAVGIGEDVGGLWRTLTMGEGHHFNCAKSDRYLHRGVGTLSADDSRIWTGIHLLLVYLTKTDELIEMELGDGKPVFTKSRLPKPSHSPGRPRSRAPCVNPYLNRRGDRRA